MNTKEKNLREETLEEVSGGMPVIDPKHRDENGNSPDGPASPLLEPYVK